MSDNTSIERQLDLPMGSLSQDTPEIRALKKILKTYPWIANVAEKGFNKYYATAALAKAIGKMDTEEIAECLRSKESK